MNFSQNIPSRKYRLIQRWMQITTILCIIILLLSIIMSVKQYYLLKTLRQEKKVIQNHLQEQLNTIHSLSSTAQKYEEIEQKISKLATFQKGKNNLLHALEWIAKQTFCPIKQFQFQKNEMKLEVACKDADQALSFVHALQKNSWCVTAQLDALHSFSNQSISARIHATLHTNS